MNTSCTSFELLFRSLLTGGGRPFEGGSLILPYLVKGARLPISRLEYFGTPKGPVLQVLLGTCWLSPANTDLGESR